MCVETSWVWVTHENRYTHIRLPATTNFERLSNKTNNKRKKKVISIYFLPVCVGANERNRLEIRNGEELLCCVSDTSLNEKKKIRSWGNLQHWRGVCCRCCFLPPQHNFFTVTNKLRSTIQKSIWKHLNKALNTESLVEDILSSLSVLVSFQKKRYSG